MKPDTKELEIDGKFHLNVNGRNYTHNDPALYWFVRDIVWQAYRDGVNDTKRAFRELLENDNDD